MHSKCNVTLRYFGGMSALGKICWNSLAPVSIQLCLSQFCLSYCTRHRIRRKHTMRPSRMATKSIGMQRLASIILEIISPIDSLKAAQPTKRE